MKFSIYMGFSEMEEYWNDLFTKAELTIWAMT
jgi:hypothetical protein